MDAVIKSSFWSDSRVEDQPPEIKLACLWLLTNPARDLCGFTVTSNRRFTFETGLAPGFLEGACKGLPGSFRKINPETYFAVHFLRHQFGKGGCISLKNKVIISAARMAARLPEGMRRPFFEEYPELEKREENEPENDPPCKAHTQKTEGVRVRERVRAGEGAEDVEDARAGKPDIPGIVAIYPRRQDAATACDHVRRHLAAGIAPEAIIAGTQAIASVISRMPSGHLNAFVPTAAKFFEKRRWEDDPATWLRADTRNGAAAQELKLGGRKALEVIKASDFKA